jgi:RimJ/RimL family protein N-acetyltransferase
MGLVLETARLLLRHLELGDIDAIYAVIGDALAMQYYPQSFSHDDAVKWIERNRQRYSADGHGLYAVELKHGGKMIGDCGIVKQFVEGQLEFEVGYHIRRDHWGRGYATEAARACMTLAFTTFDAPRVISLIRPENAPSRRVAERNGMTVEREVIYAGLPHLVYVTKRSDYVQT